MDSSSDIVKQIFNYGLRQSDVKRILSAASIDGRDELIEEIAGIITRITAIIEVSNRVSSILDLDMLLKNLIEITTQALGTDRGSLFLNDDETLELYSRIAIGELTREIRFPNSRGIAGAVFSSATALIINDAYSDARFNQEIDKQTGYRTRNILTTPIKTRQGKCIGVMQLINKHDGNFTTEDLTLLETITMQASAALQNASLFTQLQRVKDEESKLLELTKSISTELQLKPLLLKIMDTATSILEADRSTLFLYIEKTAELLSQVGQGLEGREIRIPCNVGIAGSVFISGETVNIPDAYQDSRFNQAVDKKTGYSTRSILCMPIVNKEGKCIGVMQLLNKKGGPFTVIDEKRLRAFSAQASIAIENAKLFDDVLNMKNYNESILESMSNGVISLNEDGLIVKCNVVALNILEASLDELQNKPLSHFFADKNNWVLESIKRVEETGVQDINLEMDLATLKNKTASVNLTVRQLLNTQNAKIGTLLVFEDISREKRLRSTMARYMTKEIAERLLEVGEDILGGQIQEASVLFSDIRDFTGISERLGAGKTVSMLNEYFTLMVDIIFRYGGILDKYIGDAILAVFGTPFVTPKDPDNCVNAAIEMIEALRFFNEKRGKGMEKIAIGIGINTDEVLSGNIGSLKRMDYTVIGDGVNLASRLEGANKFFGTNILISEFTRKRLNGTYLLREIDLIRVKGKLKPVCIYEVMDYQKAVSSEADIMELIAVFEDALQLYRLRKWESAIGQFSNVLDINKEDKATEMYINRCRHFMHTPPEEGWDGVWVMESK
ncbi:GAF and PAS/PAC sensor-containing adenylate/guanylate cyclase [Candidatus Magnetobacterium bavaricum]|uniref:GAF and PAS/PAC sensor-containing adenylate/guanylate cyclase n=1 Tax=Candidatus Magnetobacterium bavaricum TaxID=29290 RepID=A0A0F3GKM0_9BACT|nr:GAF and PAS/PAC sensor-containing adenylate/guanylate cyclase [Candidatus Magnetobacterium bavaricum]